MRKPCRSTSLDPAGWLGNQALFPWRLHLVGQNERVLISCHHFNWQNTETSEVVYQYLLDCGLVLFVTPQ